MAARRVTVDCGCRWEAKGEGNVNECWWPRTSARRTSKEYGGQEGKAESEYDKSVIQRRDNIVCCWQRKGR